MKGIRDAAGLMAAGLELYKARVTWFSLQTVLSFETCVQYIQDHIGIGRMAGV
jgi:hypothetical protein